MTDATKIMGLDGKPHEKIKSEEELKFEAANTRFNTVAEVLKPIMALLKSRKFNEAAGEVNKTFFDSEEAAANILAYLLVSNLEMANTISSFINNTQNNFSGMQGLFGQLDHRLSKIDGGAARL